MCLSGSELIMILVFYLGVGALFITAIVYIIIKASSLIIKAFR